MSESCFYDVFALEMPLDFNSDMLQLHSQGTNYQEYLPSLLQNDAQHSPTLSETSQNSLDRIHKEFVYPMQTLQQDSYYNNDVSTNGLNNSYTNGPSPPVASGMNLDHMSSTNPFFYGDAQYFAFPDHNHQYLPSLPGTIMGNDQKFNGSPFMTTSNLIVNPFSAHTTMEYREESPPNTLLIDQFNSNFDHSPPFINNSGGTKKQKKSKSKKSTLKTEPKADGEEEEVEDPEKVLNFNCPFGGCDKIFHGQFNLKSHLKSHATERLFLCEDCPASFKRSHDLKRHVRSLHIAVKPFACTSCVKRFSRMDALKRHTSRPNSGCFKADE